MFVIVSYDVKSGRTQLFKKISQKYLSHLQFSVFAGNITESNFRRLVNEIRVKLDKDEKMIVWEIPDSQIWKEHIFGKQKSSDDIFL